MEGMIYRIEKNEMSYEDFILHTNAFVQKITQEIIKIPDTISYNLIETWKQQIEVCQCPCRNGIILDRGNFSVAAITRTVILSCQKIKEKAIPAAQVKKLFEENKTYIIKGFKSNGKEFSAYLAFINGEISFSLPTVEELSLGQCPKCQKGQILNRKTFLGAQNIKTDAILCCQPKLKARNYPIARLKN